MRTINARTAAAVKKNEVSWKAFLLRRGYESGGQLENPPICQVAEANRNTVGWAVLVMIMALFNAKCNPGAAFFHRANQSFSHPSHFPILVLGRGLNQRTLRRFQLEQCVHTGVQVGRPHNNCGCAVSVRLLLRPKPLLPVVTLFDRDVALEHFDQLVAQAGESLASFLSD